MPYHNLSATLTDADLQAIKETIAAIKARLPFPITLTTEERRRLFKMGNKSLSFVTPGSGLVAASFKSAEEKPFAALAAYQ